MNTTPAASCPSARSRSADGKDAAPVSRRDVVVSDLDLEGLRDEMRALADGPVRAAIADGGARTPYPRRGVVGDGGSGLLRPHAPAAHGGRGEGIHAVRDRPRGARPSVGERRGRDHLGEPQRLPPAQLRVGPAAAPSSCRLWPRVRSRARSRSPSRTAVPTPRASARSRRGTATRGCSTVRSG